MFKNVVISLLAIFFIGCNSDDNLNNTNPDDDGRQGTEFNLSSYAFISYHPTPERFEYVFDDLGNIEKSYAGVPVSNANYTNFSYNPDEKIASMDLYNSAGQFLNKIYEFEYNGSGQLVKYIVYGAQSFPINTTLTYNGDQIDFLQEETGRTAKLIFENDRLITTIHNSGPSQDTKSNLFYNNEGLLIEVKNYINDNLSYTVNFEFNEVTNPLYQSYSKNQIAFLALNIYDMDFTGTYEPFTKKLEVKETISGGVNRIDESTYQLNEEGYAISASVMRNGTLVTEQTFGYIEQ